MAYFSHQLTAAQRNYSASELECLAVVEAVDHFALHLLRHRLTVVTDHRALVALFNSTRLNGRLMRWALALQAFDMDIKYRPGIYQQNADGLSRQGWLPEEAATTMNPARIQLRLVAATHRTEGVDLEELEVENLSSGRFSSRGARDVEGQPSTWPSQAKNPSTKDTMC